VKQASWKTLKTKATTLAILAVATFANAPPAHAQAPTMTLGEAHRALKRWSASFVAGYERSYGKRLAWTINPCGQHGPNSKRVRVLACALTLPYLRGGCWRIVVARPTSPHHVTVHLGNEHLECPRQAEEGEDFAPAASGNALRCEGNEEE
jgi:hypothetical protein